MEKDQILNYLLEQVLQDFDPPLSQRVEKKLRSEMRKLSEGSELRWNASVSTISNMGMSRIQKVLAEEQEKKSNKEQKFLEKMSKTLPNELVKGCLKSVRWNFLEKGGKIFLLQIWNDVFEKIDKNQDLKQGWQEIIYKSLNQYPPPYEQGAMDCMKRMLEFNKIQYGLERFAIEEDLFNQWNPIFKECMVLHPLLLAKLVDEEIDLEEFQEMFDTFGEYPEAILRILNGEDKEAVAVDFDLLQMG
tara:strand:- start:437 stop:1174 length:738 start_codon:yes stop_codon:yes gene_type:complete